MAAINLTEAIVYFITILSMILNLLVYCQCSTFKIPKIIFKLTILALSQVGF